MSSLYSRPDGMRRIRQGGFTLVELLIVIAIIGIIANIAVPHYLQAMRKTRATKIISDFTFLRSEILRYQTETGTWPRGARWGREPRDLRPYLKGKMAFGQGTIQYRLRNRMRRRAGSVPYRLSFEVRGDPRVLDYVEKIWDEPLYERRNRRRMWVNFVIAG